MAKAKPLVGILMGSTSDWEVMKQAAKMLDEFGVAYDARAMSAHRTPDLVEQFVKAAPGRGIKCIIAGAGGAAHLAGVVASHTTLPVLRRSNSPTSSSSSTRAAGTSSRSVSGSRDPLSVSLIELKSLIDER